jgi:hypothetical protein
MFPGWIKGKYYNITASTSVGKTQLTKYLVLFSVYKAWKESNQSFDFKINWFSLEEPEEDFWLSLLCYAIFGMTGGSFKLFPRLIKGQTKRILTEDELKLVIKAENSDFIKVMQEKVTCIDNIYNPTGKTCN